MKITVLPRGPVHKSGLYPRASRFMGNTAGSVLSKDKQYKSKAKRSKR